MREMYYWLALIVVILAVALYIRYYNNPGINVSLSFLPNQGTVYAYQRITLPLVVTNNGGSIKDFDVGLYINGNLSKVYNVTLSQGKQATFDIVYSFGNPGNYNFTATGDPAKLYNVADRSAASSSVNVYAANETPPAPESMLPPNASRVYSVNMVGKYGYVVPTQLGAYYNLTGFSLSDISSVNTFLYPLLNETVLANYVANVSYAGADYASGKAFSIWISGYLDPSIIEEAAVGVRLNASSVMVGSDNVTFVELGSNTTLCSWYSGGWLKSFAYEGRTSCVSMLNTYNTSANSSVGFLMGKNRPLNASFELANGSSYSANQAFFGRFSLYLGDSVVYSMISKGAGGGGTCYGVISLVNGTSYCSTYLLATGGNLTNDSLVRTTAVIGNYSASAYSLFENVSTIYSHVDNNIGIIRSFNLSGNSTVFKSGLVNVCSFESGFYCANSTFGNGALTFRISNELNATAKINGVSCAWNGVAPVTEIGKNMSASGSMNITTACYNNGLNITGVPLGLTLRLVLNYSVGNRAYNTTGSAYVVV
jgi:hypothetical protein